MDKNLLRAVMTENGDNYDTLAKKLGMTVSTLSNKINEKSNNGFTQPEILKMKELYKLSALQIDRIFFKL